MLRVLEHSSVIPPRNPKVDCPTLEEAKSLVPAGAPDWITHELIERTIAVWQPFYEEVITPEEAATMIAGVGRLFDVFSSRLSDETIRSIGACK